ncbi:MAG: metalloregulator ArsR/SmtB family transcription factor [Pseudomonadota bacterium]
MSIDHLQAATIFAQLGNDTRLCIIRILVEAGGEGLRVGEIQQEVGVPASTLSHHLLHLKNAGLIAQHKDRNALVCTAQFDVINSAIDYLQSACCVRVDTK